MTWFNYLGLALPRPPSFVGLDNMAIDEPLVYVDEFQRFEIVDYYRTVNLMNGRRTQEKNRVDRWSNVRRRKRWKELSRRRARG